jgi:hypothetical protein
MNSFGNIKHCHPNINIHCEHYIHHYSSICIEYTDCQLLKLHSNGLNNENNQWLTFKNFIDSPLENKIGRCYRKDELEDEDDDNKDVFITGNLEL